MPVTLATRRIGTGPRPVFVLHGLLGQGRNWQAIAKRLAGEELSLWLVDLRNHGASPWAEPMRYEAMAEDLAAAIAREGVARAGLVGHSMGGKAAMVMALTRPELVERLCLVDIAPVDYGRGQGFAGYLRAMLALDLARYRRRAEVEEALASAVPDPAVRAFLATNVEVRGDRLVWLPNLRVLLDALPELTGWPDHLDGRRFDGPALFLRGERSDYVRDDYVPAIKALFPRAEVETVAGAGHWLHAEKPQATVDALQRFLAAARSA